ncbi:MAG: hypothetical protein H0W69_11195 [Gemmatimonadaceae bacterium]|nr:hypothetical protein [Gemmatimonadaceae bacterium]
MSNRVDIWVESAGLGHVTRQVNLMAHLCERDVMAMDVRFLIDDNPATRAVVEGAGHAHAIRDADDATAFQALFNEWKHSPPALFILDSVAMDKNPNASLALTHPAVTSVVFIDDPGDRDVECGLLVNALPSLDAPVQKLKARRALRGVEYLVLAREYSKGMTATRTFASCASGFAFFGGADLEDFTSVFLDALAAGAHVERWSLLLGPSYKHVDSVSERIDRDDLPVTVIRHVESMAEALRNADIAVLGSGNTLSEAAAVGTPAIVLSQNFVQAENAKFFATRSGIIDLGMLAPDSAPRLADAIASLSKDTRRREGMSEQMMKTVDGKGGKRIARLLAETLTGRQ